MNFPQLEQAISEHLREKGKISYSDPLLQSWLKSLGGEVTEIALITTTMHLGFCSLRLSSELQATVRLCGRYKTRAIGYEAV